MPAQQPADPNGKPSIYVPFGSGQRGHMFTDLAQLDSFIGRWQTVVDGIEEDSADIRQAARMIKPPAHDNPSVNQADAARNSLTDGYRHNDDLRVRAQNYLDRLIATRTQYASDDQAGEDRLRNVDPD